MHAVSAHLGGSRRACVSRTRWLDWRTGFPLDQGQQRMDTITTTDGTRIFFKDWGPRDAQVLFFHHGWPLSADDWDNQIRAKPGRVSKAAIISAVPPVMVKSDKNPGGRLKAFSETDFTEDLKKIDVPVLVMHGDDDQIVPYADSAPLSSKLLQRGTLKTCKGFPHGMCTTHPEVINPDLLAFVRS
jgi:pimeloyl-ACP methyl ester carboxylesterase